MIKTYKITRKGHDIILGIAVRDSVLDILSNVARLQECLQALRHTHDGLVSLQIGTFGNYPVTLTLLHNDAVSVLVDVPNSEKSRSQSAGMRLGKEDLQRLLAEAVQASNDPLEVSTAT